MDRYTHETTESLIIYSLLCVFQLYTNNDNDGGNSNTFVLGLPVSVTLLADGEVCTIVDVVVAAVTGSEQPANILARWTAHFRRSVGIALTAVCVTWTVKSVVVATARCE